MSKGAIALYIFGGCLLIAAIAYFLFKPGDKGFIETIGLLVDKLFPPPVVISTAQPLAKPPVYTPPAIAAPVVTPALVTPTPVIAPVYTPPAQVTPTATVPVYTPPPVTTSTTTSTAPVTPTITAPVYTPPPQSVPVPVPVSTTAPVTAPIATTTTSSTPVPAPAPIPLLTVPAWGQQKEIEGLLTLPDKRVLAFQIAITATPSTSDVQIQGSGLMINPQLATGRINLKCVVKDGKVSFAVQDETSRVSTYTGTLQTGSEQSLSSDAAGTMKIWPRGSKNTLKLPLKMEGFLVQDCTRYPFDCLVIGVGSDIYMNGSDSLGSFVMTGTASGSQSQDINLQKLYRKPDSKAIAYKGVRSGDVVKGQWTITNEGYVFYNEFVMYPAAVSYTDSVDLYGTGAACKYATDWKGGLTINGGEKADGTLSSFQITEAGLLQCSGTDKYGNYTFQGQVTNKEVTIDKYYEGASQPVKLTGTLTTNVLQGTWTLGDMTGTFMYMPK